MNQDKYRLWIASLLLGVGRGLLLFAVSIIITAFLVGCGPSVEQVIAEGYSQCITYAQGDKVEEMRCDIQREGALNREQQYYTALMLMTP